MSTVKEQRGQLSSGERGSIMIMTAIFALLLLLMVGMCLDVSRIYLVRTELQNATDAAALAAARELNGGTAGIDDAVTQANAIANTQGLRGKTGVGIATVEFAVNVDDNPYLSAATAKLNAPNIRFVKVTTQATSTTILFASSALGASRSESRWAVAGMSVGLDGICDFFPAAVAMNDSDPLTPGFQPPAANTLLTLHFSQGTGNAAVLNDRDYIILEVPNINGNGTGETADLAAGLPNYCKKLGDNINMTPSSNPNNGPRNSGDGMNTRFNVYANGYGNSLQPSTFPPDSNIKENISATDYKNKAVGQVTTPSPNGPGKDDRRMLIAPIILPGTYPAYTTNIQAWGIFFLRSKVPTPNGNCSNTPGCGSIPVEYVGKANVSASGVVTCSSGLTTPVLYR
ncbi:MAG: TadE/TadG family type IV pilus assembly protein [bacterium]